ncbi:LysR family transcriptional regulator [Achromobacter mucicolens]|uniref:HTH-type transcriptional activator CmpR n=2 Tax=Achromobacter mucicolens TaxID=1389922 RepID=A0ABM8LLM3_9BURK|nr:HTH-type transcriptional activator CmpR [Achromobacter mucicolens]
MYFCEGEVCMNYRAYEALHAFVEGGSVAQAALRLHRTQPQVSRLLAQLEEEAGFEVLRKTGRRLELTDDGHEFYKRVYGLLRAQDAVADYAEDMRQGRRDRVRVLAANHIIDGLAIEAVGRCRLKNPAFSAALNARMPAELQWWLAQQQFDLALVQLPLEHPAIETELLCQSEIVAVMHPDHPYARRSQIGPEDLQTEPYISLGRRSILEQRCLAAFEATNAAAHSELEVSFSTMAIQLAAMNCGIALADPMATLAQRHLHIAVRKFRPTVKLHYGLVFPKGKRRSPATEQLVDELRNVAKERVPELRRLLSMK